MIRVAQVETVFEQVNRQAAPESLVTVAVSLYNYAQFLPECLDSVRAQRHPHLDLVVVDDASTEEASAQVARDWLAAHADRFGRVLLLRHRRNQGLAMARNTAFEHARGDLVFVIDADNAIYPRAIGRLAAAMQGSAFGAAYTQLEFFGAEQRLGYADLWQRKWFRTGNYVDAMALVSKRAWREVEGYTHIDGGWEDYDFWCKFAERGLSAAYVPEILCRYRVHPASMLRTETAKAHDGLVVDMMLRHPWLELRTISDRR